MRVEVKGGTFSYDGKQDIFSGLDLLLEGGEVMAVLGPNGSGKTTFLRCLMGMLQPTGGRWLIDGRDIAGMKSRDFWKLVSYVPQQRAAQNAYTAFESILLGRSVTMGVFAKPSDPDVEAVERIMEELGIAKLKNRDCRTLSGGEFQLVLIARALVSDPQLLILDEPESGLDFKNQLAVLDTVDRLAKKGIACIFNTHYPEHALQRADKALLIGGKTARFGAVSDIVNTDNIEEAFGVKVLISSQTAGDTVVKSVIPLYIMGNEREGYDD